MTIYVPVGDWGELLLILVLLFTATQVNIGSNTRCICDIMFTCSLPASIHSNYLAHICGCPDMHVVAADTASLSMRLLAFQVVQLFLFAAISVSACLSLRSWPT